MGGGAGSTVAQREAEVADNLFRSLSSSCHYRHQEVTLLLHCGQERPSFEADLILFGWELHLAHVTATARF